MKNRNLLKGIVSAVGMLVLILDGQTAVSGIRCGVDICLKTLIPSLFPFFVISGLVTGSLSGRSIPLLRRICRLCRIPVGSETLLTIGFLSGYPVGAKNVHDVWERQQISVANAQRFSLLCSNAGPAFIFGILGPMFSGLRWAWALWLLQIVSALVTATLFQAGEPGQLKQADIHTVNWAALMNQSVKSMASVCAWVTIFRMVLEFLNRWFLCFLPDWGKTLATGLLELSNGCLELANIQNPQIRFLLASVILPLGGLCVWMQIQSVFPELDFRFYLKWKILQSGLCFFEALLMLLPLRGVSIGLSNKYIVAGILAMAVFLLLIRKKAVAIP